MALQVRLKPVESLLFRSDLVAVGAFRCHATHPLFRDSGPCSSHTFVFPRTSTVIRHDGKPAFTGGPNTVSLYNEGQLYTREAIDEADVSDWFAVAGELVTEAVAEFDPSVGDRPAQPFRHACAPADPALYHQQRGVFAGLKRSAGVDPLEIEETVIALLTRVLAAAFSSRATRGSSRDAAEDAKRHIAAAPAADIPLRVIARAVGRSPYQLCRDFRRATGTTMSRYRNSLRLRIALDQLEQTTDLTRLALDLGYSSHSHFTFAFRREFGVPPSVVRAMR